MNTSNNLDPLDQLLGAARNEIDTTSQSTLLDERDIRRVLSRARLAPSEHKESSFLQMLYAAGTRWLPSALAPLSEPTPAWFSSVQSSVQSSVRFAVASLAIAAIVTVVSFTSSPNAQTQSFVALSLAAQTPAERMNLPHAQPVVAAWQPRMQSAICTEALHSVHSTDAQYDVQQDVQQQR
jgi:hypothetical protein